MKKSIKATRKPEPQNPNVKIDAGLAYELRVFAAKARMSQKDVVTAAVRQYLSRSAA